MKETQFKNVDPPLWVAWNQAVAGIRVRFLRQSVTSLGIALGIAFFTGVEATRLSGPRLDSVKAAQSDWLIATALVMCLVGVTNSMLMSVTERYREIGTIKCLGASDGFIVKVFVMEAMLLGLAGSVSGSTVAGLLMLVASGGAVTGLGAAEAACSGCLAGVAMTVIAAIAPAYQAARMPAAAALRVEI